MAEWMTIRVVLRGSADDPLALPPGRVFLAHTAHTFADLAAAVDRAFARWDTSPLHLFEVAGRTLASDVELADAGPGAEASADVALDVVPREETFSYVFDLGEGWEHDCEVEQSGVDPLELVGEEPGAPVPVFGWGTIPDQYGRETEQDDDEDAVMAIDLDAAEWEPESAWDEEAELAAWDQARESAWAVVAEAVGAVDRPLPAEELARAAGDLRTVPAEQSGARALLWAVADLDEPPADDAALWTALAATVVEPQGEADLAPEVEAAWAALEPADWAGAVIELVRAGVGQSAEPAQLVQLIERCPEIEGPPLSEEDADLIRTAFGAIVPLWQVLGAVDDDHRLTPLGRWGLPESLRRAWLGEAAVSN